VPGDGARALKTLPLAAAIVARDEAVLGKYLRKRGNVLDRLPATGGTQEFLRAMQDVGACRPDADARAVAFVLDSQTLGHQAHVRRRPSVR
jgi:hypothetical protein